MSTEHIDAAAFKEAIREAEERGYQRGREHGRREAAAARGETARRARLDAIREAIENGRPFEMPWRPDEVAAVNEMLRNHNGRSKRRLAAR